MIHSTSEVHTNNIGKNTNIWQFCVILSDAIIGNDCNINSHVFIEDKVIIGNRVTIKSGVQIWDGVEIGDNVFVGPNVTFTNDRYPRSKKDFNVLHIRLNNGCTIGANSTILPGIVIGEFAMIGAGSVVSRNVPDRALVYGNPARIVGWVDEDGHKMTNIESGLWKDKAGREWFEFNNTIKLQ